MTVLEKGKFIKNFVRVDNNGKLSRAKHSNFRGYSKADVEAIEPQINPIYLKNWELFLQDQKDSYDKELYPDWKHFLFYLNSISDEDIKKYNLPTTFIVVEYDPWSIKNN